ncbi:MAG: hypothetical protein JRH11_03325 [Deltaproteobacteria bacterium]|nr:hypothetical protein [Deltaproteobacteria bacterium]
MTLGEDLEHGARGEFLRFDANLFFITPREIPGGGEVSDGDLHDGTPRGSRRSHTAP